MQAYDYATELCDEFGFICAAVVRLEFDHTAYEAPSRDCPGSPETVDVRSATVFVGNFELGTHPAPLKAWEATVWQHIREQRRADELDRGLARAA
jgi:hypothetical protein